MKTPMLKGIAIDRSDVISIMALLMSLGAFFVALKQTSILKEQQKIMASQQEGSVWPHLDVQASAMQDSLSATLDMKVVNNGIGPAIITNFKFNGDFEDKLDFNGLQELLGNYKISPYLELSFEHPDGNTIPAGHEVSIIKIKAGNPEENYTRLFELLSELSESQYCYESVYEKEYGEACK